MENLLSVCLVNYTFFIHIILHQRKINFSIYVKGQRLCVSDKANIAGPGTYEQQGYIYSKLAGTVKLITEEKVSYIYLLLQQDKYLQIHIIADSYN